MSTKAIRAPAADAVTCDVCGRTLLRGERAHSYLDGAVQRSVCELCTVRANEEGWIREGTVPDYDGRDSGSDRRRSILGRLRRRRPPAASPEPEPFAFEEPQASQPAPPVERPRSQLREPRHVHAIPSSPAQRIAAAIAAFNRSEHPRTVSGVTRSLGLPIVSVGPLEERPSVVRLVVAWELCWYRYEVDLADGDGGVRVAAQGAELDELDPIERVPNAVCDEQGSLTAGA